MDQKNKSRKPRPSVKPSTEPTATAEDLQEGAVAPEMEQGDVTPVEIPQTVEATEEPEVVKEEVPTGVALPCVATVTAGLAVLSRSAGLGTEEMLKPVATLKQGTMVTVRAIEGDSAQLANGLWTKTAYLDLGK